MALAAVLRGSTVKDIPPPKAIITLESTDDPRDGYKKISDANVRSAPVRDVRTGKYIGFLDVRDLTAFIVFEAKERESKMAQAFSGSLDRLKYMDSLIETGAKMYDQPMDGFTIPYLSRRHGFHCVDESATIEDVTTLLVRKGCHRVPVVNGAGEIVNIVSQSSIIRFLVDHKAELGPVAGHTVRQMACGSAPVISVNESEPVLAAFELMSTHDVMGVAVVDDDGVLIANTSASDLKEFLRDPSTSLKLPAADFIGKVRRHDTKAVHPAMAIHPDDTLEKVLAKLAKSRVHRVFVVDEGKLLSVMSLSDILKYVAHHKGE